MPMSMDPYGGEFQGTGWKEFQGTIFQIFWKTMYQKQEVDESKLKLVFSLQVSADQRERLAMFMEWLDQIKEKKKKKKDGHSSVVTYQKSTRCAEKSGTGDDLGGQYKEKLPIRIKFPSPCRLGRIPTVSLARAVVYSTSNSAMITMEIMIDEIIEEE
ncbi:hypothetical protein YC2023_002043 [Brassica napus]